MSRGSRRSAYARRSPASTSVCPSDSLRVAIRSREASRHVRTASPCATGGTTADRTIWCCGATRERADRQVGTLGGGNHFVELQADSEGALWLMLHTGSRSFGKAVCARWHAEALARCTSDGIRLPNRELAYLDVASTSGVSYLRDMRYAMRYAEESRARIYERTLEALGETFGAIDATEMLETHHNFAALESRDGRDLLVHRKGAVRTTDASGEGALV